MNHLSYEIGCRNCLKSDGRPHLFMLPDDEDSVYEYLIQTEFEVYCQLESDFLFDERRCDFCNSINIEFINISVNNFPLYSYDKLVRQCIKKEEYLFMINIDKNNNEINLNIGGSNSFDNDFLNAAISDVLYTLNDRPSDNFVQKDNGNFFICLTGEKNSWYQGDSSIKTQRFRNAGLTLDEIKTAIKTFTSESNIEFNDSDE